MDPTRVFGVRLTDEQRHPVKEAAARQGLTESEVVRNLIRAARIELITGAPPSTPRQGESPASERLPAREKPAV